MDRQQSEIVELTADELDEVSGGMRNNQTEAWAYVQIGIMVGRQEASGMTLTCGWP